MTQAKGFIYLFVGYFLLRGMLCRASREDTLDFVKALVVVNTIAAGLFILHQGLHLPIYNDHRVPDAHVHGRAHHEELLLHAAAPHAGPRLRVRDAAVDLVLGRSAGRHARGAVGLVHALAADHRARRVRRGARRAVVQGAAGRAGASSARWACRSIVVRARVRRLRRRCRCSRSTSSRASARRRRRAASPATPTCRTARTSCAARTPGSLPAAILPGRGSCRRRRTLTGRDRGDGLRSGVGAGAVPARPAGGRDGHAAVRHGGVARRPG